MARKHLLDGLDGAKLPAGNFGGDSVSARLAPPSLAPHLSVMGRGAIGAVTRSIEQLKINSIVELAPELIEASFVTDRLKGSDEHHRSLVASIQEHGQQVPVLVRPHPDKKGRFQIAYGRRRLLALTELGRNVRAIVKPLTDEQLVVAQGQENSARKDLSFIEKALFAARLEQGGFSRETIMASLTVDKSGLSRLIAVAVKIPADLIEAIGSAPTIGRDRWIDLSVQLEAEGALAAAREAVLSDGFDALESDARFNQLIDVLTVKPPKAIKPTVWKADGIKIGRIQDDPKMLALMINKKTSAGFAAYLLKALPEIYATYKRDDTTAASDVE